MGRSIAKLLAAATVVWGLGGCAVDSSEPATATEDITSFSVLQAELGDSLDLSVERRIGGSTTDRHAKVIRFHVDAGQSFALVMRATGSEQVDAYLALYGEQVGGDRLSESVAQRVLPMATEDDALVVYTADDERDYLLFVADRYLEITGTFQLDLIPLPAAADVDWNAVDHGRAAYTDALRESDEELTSLLDQGAAVEQPTGLLEADVTNVALRDRTDVNGFVARQNERRTNLFNRFDGSPDAAARVGETLAGVWAQLRSPEHALR